MKKPKGRYTIHKGGDCFDKIEVGVETTPTRQPDSTHMFLCPLCEDRCYADRRFMERIVAAQAWLATLPPNSIEILGPACEPCHAVMEVHVLGKEQEVTPE